MGCYIVAGFKYLLFWCICKNHSFPSDFPSQDLTLLFFISAAAAPSHQILESCGCSHQVQVPCQPSPLNRWLLKVGHHLTAAYLRPPYSCCLFIGPYFSALSSPPVRLLAATRPRSYLPRSLPTICQQQTVPLLNRPLFHPPPVCQFSSNNHSISLAFFRLNSSLIIFSLKNTYWNILFGLSDLFHCLAHPNEKYKMKKKPVPNLQERKAKL